MSPSTITIRVYTVDPETGRQCEISETRYPEEGSRRPGCACLEHREEA